MKIIVEYTIPNKGETTIPTLRFDSNLPHSPDHQTFALLYCLTSIFNIFFFYLLHRLCINISNDNGNERMNENKNSIQIIAFQMMIIGSKSWRACGRTETIEMNSTSWHKTQRVKFTKFDTSIISSRVELLRVELTIQPKKPHWY